MCLESDYSCTVHAKIMKCYMNDISPFPEDASQFHPFSPWQLIETSKNINPVKIEMCHKQEKVGKCLDEMFLIM